MRVFGGGDEMFDIDEIRAMTQEARLGTKRLNGNRALVPPSDREMARTLKSCSLPKARRGKAKPRTLDELIEASESSYYAAEPVEEECDCCE